MPNLPLTDCQLLIDPPAEGAWNMAVDEALLEATAESNQPTLRFYQWQRPTLSLGYFQSFDERKTHAPSQTADVVRRLSGGGAIVHDQELTYSLFLPGTHPLSRDTQGLYNAVHKVIIEVLQELLTPACTWQPLLCEPTEQLNSAEEPFLCFQRRSSGDILLHQTAMDSQTRTHKVVGSAQRRRRGTVLQHGSILLSQSPVATELLGIADVCNTQLSPEALLTKLPYQIAKVLRLEIRAMQISEAISEVAKNLQKTKYQVSSWTARR